MSPQGFSIQLVAHRTGTGSVRVEVSTDVPGIIEVMADVSLSGQKPDDVWIGANTRVEVVDGFGEALIDVSKLPKALYDVDVGFYSRWGQKDDRSKAAGPIDDMQAICQLHLAGNGSSAAASSLLREGQKWVMLNVSSGQSWNPTFWIQKFGEWRELGVDRGNPEILKAYYFAVIDMTLIVNTLKVEVVTWRTGQAHH